MKEHIIKIYYVIKHSNMHEKFKGKVRRDKFESLKAKQSAFIKTSTDIVLTVKLSFKVLK